MLTRESCTLYIKTGNGFERYYIPLCHWQESKSANVLKSGLTSADGVTVYVFAQDIGDELKTLLTTRKFAAQDLIVNGECHFTFDNSTPQSVSESLRTFNATIDGHTVMSVDKLLYGSLQLQHFKFSAR